MNLQAKIACSCPKGLMINSRNTATATDIPTGSAYTILTEKLKVNNFLLDGYQNCCTQISYRQGQSCQWIFLTSGIKILNHFSQELFTGDETWLSQYFPKGKAQSKQWLPRARCGPVKIKAHKSKVKVIPQYFRMLIAFWLLTFSEGTRMITFTFHKEF